MKETKIKQSTDENTMKTIKRTSIYLLGIVLMTAACSDDPPTPSEDEQIAAMLEEVRTTTASFTDIGRAIDAGWDTDLSGCVEHPAEGGMGHHYARLEWLDGRVNHLEPQVLLYVMGDDGEMEFLGLEYVVPFDFVGPDEAPPVLFFHEFHANHDQGFWALHVWTEKDNPKGMFYDWNPNVSCP